MKQIVFIIAALLGTANINAQSSTQSKRVSQYIDLAVTAGQSRGSAALSYVHQWKLGARKKWTAGLGARFTASFGTKQDFVTAPARLARSNSTPFLIVFAGQKTENWDTLTVQRPWVNAFNATANFGYQFSDRLGAGFNIDLVGFAFGRTSAAILTSDGITRTEPRATVKGFNALLTGDLDYGNLNSEFFLQYRLNNTWSLRAVYQFIFNEYNTNSIHQAAPDGTLNNRFRNKANNFGLALSRYF